MPETESERLARWEKRVRALTVRKRRFTEDETDKEQLARMKVALNDLARELHDRWVDAVRQETSEMLAPVLQLRAN